MLWFWLNFVIWFDFGRDVLHLWFWRIDLKETSFSFRSSCFLLDLGLLRAAFSISCVRWSRFRKFLGIDKWRDALAMGSHLCLVNLKMCYLMILIWSGDLLFNNSDLMDLFRELCNYDVIIWKLKWSLMYDVVVLGFDFPFDLLLFHCKVEVLSSNFTCLSSWIIVPRVCYYGYLHFWSFVWILMLPGC